ncbi:MAG: radical SAM protein, partial [Clostridiales bacterium]|nr:radical SAM protein [Clostridiales bacterium]
RLGSLESPTITPLFLDRLSSLNHFCPSFHLSLQSGSDPILKRMARRDTTESFRKAVALIRDSFPDAGITADLIVGFPGESDEDFQKTLAFCDEIAFLRLHVFRFSARPGTRAATMPAQVPGDVVQLRSEILRKKSDALFQNAVRRHVGQVLNILVEQYDKDGFILGYTPEYIHVKAKPETPHMPMPARGDIIPVKIKGLDQDFATAALL